MTDNNNINKEHIGSDFDDFLAEDNSLETLEKCTSVAKKRVEEQKITNTLVKKFKD